MILDFAVFLLAMCLGFDFILKALEACTAVIIGVVSVVGSLFLGLEKRSAMFAPSVLHLEVSFILVELFKFLPSVVVRTTLAPERFLAESALTTGEWYSHILHSCKMNFSSAKTM
jgi:hypothetical protein